MADSYADRPRTKTVVAIRYLRAVAASLVTFHHALGIPVFADYTAHFGTVGVDLFFVISGFIMWTTTEQSARGPVQFWLARIVRIVCAPNFNSLRRMTREAWSRPPHHFA